MDRLIDTGSIPLPGIGNTKVTRQFAELSDDLTGISLKTLLEQAIVWNGRKTQSRVGAKSKKSTGFKGKPFTFLINKYMIRGPFLSTASYPQEVQDTILMADILWKLKLTSILRPLAILKELENDFYFIVYPNPHTGYPESISMHSEQSFTYHVLSNSIIKSVEDIVINSETFPEYTKNWITRSLVDLVLLYSIGVNNITFSNVLVNTISGETYIREIEILKKADTASDDLSEGNSLFYFVLPENTSYLLVDAWNDLISSSIREAIGTLDMYDLIDLGFSPEMINRCNIGKALLNRFIDNQFLRVEKKDGWPDYEPGKTEMLAMKVKPVKTHVLHYSPTPETPVKFIGQADLMRNKNLSSRAYVTREMLREYYPTLPVTITTPHYPVINTEAEQPKKFTVDVPTKFTMPNVVVPDIKPLALVKKRTVYGPRGGMEMGMTRKGHKSNTDSHKTYSSFTVKTMRVALRKYIQGGIIMKAIQCMTEIWRLHEIGDYSALIELFKTIAVCVLEDISVANIDLVYSVVYYCNYWHKKVEKVIKKGGEIDIPFSEAAFLIWKMCESPKTHYANDVWTCFNDKKYELEQHGIQTVEGMEYRSYFTNIEMDIVRKFFSAKDPEPIQMTGGLFYSNLKEIDGNSTIWLNTYYNLSYPNDKDVEPYTIHYPRANKTDPAYIIFDMFRDLFSVKDDKIELFTKIFKRLPKKNNKSVFQYLTVCYLTQLPIGNLLSLPRALLDTIPSQTFLNGKYQLELDEIILKDIELGGETPIIIPLQPEAIEFREFGPYYKIMHS